MHRRGEEAHTKEEEVHTKEEEVHTKEEEVLLSQTPKQKGCVLYQTIQKSGKKKEERYVKKERKKSSFGLDQKLKVKQVIPSYLLDSTKEVLLL